MKKGIFLALIFVCRSHQRPAEFAVGVTTTTTTTAAATPETTTAEEPSTEVEKVSVEVTEATAAVSVRTSVNVSSYGGPREVFEDFKPSNYYRPDGNPIFERPSPQVSREIFHKPEYFRRPDDYNLPAYQLPALKNYDRNIVFPPAATAIAATQKRYFEPVRHNNESKNGSNESRSGHPYTFAEVSSKSSYKPVKHDSGEIPNFPNYGTYDYNTYEKHFGKYYGNEMSHYPDVIHEPPKIGYHGGNGAIRKKNDPWKSMLSILATILPVGLLLASFPPTVIKVNSTQYPYQFQKNSTSYTPNVITGRYKALREKNAGRKLEETDDDVFRFYLDDCLKKKICENIKTSHSVNELESLLQNNKSINGLADNRSTILEIAKAATSTSPESCRIFTCSS